MSLYSPFPIARLGRGLRDTFDRRPEGRTPEGRFLYIDGLRGAAAGYVLLYHFWGCLSAGFAPGSFPKPIAFIAEHGWLGVEVFFVLSGFVIAHSLRDAKVTRAFVGRFIVRRSLRLDPAYWATVLLAYFLTPLVASPAQGREGVGVLLATMLYLDRLLHLPTLLLVGWTLCLEIQLYLTYILLLGVAQRWSRTSRGGGLTPALVFVGLAGWSLLVSFEVLPEPHRGLCLPYAYMFLLGVLASHTHLRRVSIRWFACAIAILIIAISLRWNLRAATTALTAVSIVLVGRLGRLQSFPNWPWLQHLGQISYSLYLTHVLVGCPVIFHGTRLLSDWPIGLRTLVLLLAGAGASLFVAELLFRTVERPSQAFGRWLTSPAPSGRRPTTPVDPLAPIASIGTGRGDSPQLLFPARRGECSTSRAIGG
jgi:peptidoglycan/LPS O-acetylase OafA/YrhL